MSRVDSLIEQRNYLLAGCFALSVHAYAVMSNHLHLVIYTDPAAANHWSDDEVIERWRTALPTHRFDSRSLAETHDPPPGPKVSDEWIVDKRVRLTSLSWFMKLLNEPRIRVTFWPLGAANFRLRVNHEQCQACER